MSVLSRAGVACAAVLATAAAASLAHAQAFADAKKSLASYTNSDTTPQKPCESLAAFKAEGVLSIAARVVAATADTPQHCRVTGTIAPEVGFEVNLPERWNRRFYMTGNGGLAGDRMDQPTTPIAPPASPTGSSPRGRTPAMIPRRNRAAPSSSAIRRRPSTTPTVRCT